MFELFLPMLERLGIIVTVAFIITRFRFLRELIDQKTLDSRQQYMAIAFFGVFGIIGTYTGITYDTSSFDFGRWTYTLVESEALANSRVIGIVAAGLFGGYRIGIGAGIIAGVHRFSLGGFTGAACGISAVVAGVIAGYFHKKGKPLKLKTAFFVGALAETLQMGIILLISDPFARAWVLVQEIGLPMVAANGVGSALFLLIIRNVLHEEEKVGALQAQKALRLAESTVSHLRKGLTKDSAEKACQIIFKEVQVSAISMTDKERILAHVGQADDHHKAGEPIQTDATREVIHTGERIVVRHEDIHCQHPSCPLGAAVIVPLKKRQEVVGTLKFYVTTPKEISNVLLELIQGLSSLLSQQLELADAEKAQELAREAEVKALQAQVNPHFLFNSLNVIVSLTRTEPDKARSLLIALSRFFRQNLGATTKTWTTLKEELKHVKAYLLIEETRFVDRLHVDYDVDESALSARIAPLTLQPLVENSIKHGIKDQEVEAQIIISIQQVGGHVEILVKDNGAGIDGDRLKTLGEQSVESSVGTGFGLFNVNKRLEHMHGEGSKLQIKSNKGQGTDIAFSIPFYEKETLS
ncbi:two-component system, LytT family, sensor histidine kinase LytS [Halobacillus karajensis]|uniref:histidine kinase n=1 Tax=Halobacillus karajensis TaxID=195088 RepID=A0A024P9F0_9BACI|nr:sensor histidine kinase [Halobacillus karajensis]CDQ21549.1 Sensor histidine kinase YpdA [Halobacillus karajensis]CDQ25483.1 Sensor histidine kinase YpdA [Halobacillus karajensis]CDQ28986.1 Sensor histidine kinase YpdA [Halobacillus karajensis]SEI09084.1 two-component system, LytT family, sensor histidine kinase LytS [Halobacillus karajensis]